MGKDTYRGPLEQVRRVLLAHPEELQAGMRVDGLIFADDKLLEQIRQDQAPEQVANVAFLPGIQHASLAMPDIHWGYGFCIGGVCATDPDEGGVISPGGVGYDINCGVRLVRSNLSLSATSSRSCGRWSRSCSARSRPASARSGRYHVQRTRSCTSCWAKGRAYLVGRGLATQRATSTTPRPTADSTAPTRTPSATAR